MQKQKSLETDKHKRRCQIGENAPAETLPGKERENMTVCRCDADKRKRKAKGLETETESQTEQQKNGMHEIGEENKTKHT